MFFNFLDTDTRLVLTYKYTQYEMKQKLNSKYSGKKKRQIHFLFDFFHLDFIVSD